MKAILLILRLLKVQIHNPVLASFHRTLQSVTAASMKSEIPQTDAINIPLMHVPIAVRDLPSLILFHMIGKRPQWTSFHYATTVLLSIEILPTHVIMARQYAAVTADPKWQFMRKMN